MLTLGFTIRKKKTNIQIYKKYTNLCTYSLAKEDDDNLTRNRQ